MSVPPLIIAHGNDPATVAGSERIDDLLGIHYPIPLTLTFQCPGNLQGILDIGGDHQAGGVRFDLAQRIQRFIEQGDPQRAAYLVGNGLPHTIAVVTDQLPFGRRVGGQGNGPVIRKRDSARVKAA